MKKILLTLLFSLSMLTVPAIAQTPGEVPIGGTLREAQLDGLNTPARKLSTYRGKPLIINVWASWCGPCQLEMGSLQRLARRYGGRQFNVIGISTDDYRDRALGFLQQTASTIPSYIDSKLFMEHMLGADRIPLTLLVDAQGRVLDKYYGAKEWDSPEALSVIAQTFRVKL